MIPRVLFGARTNDDDAVSEPLALGGGPPAAASASGPPPPPLHLVAEASDGRGPLRACRTLFLSQGRLTRDPFAGEEDGRRLVRRTGRVAPLQVR